VHGIQPAKCEMVGIDCDGFDLRADGRLLRFDFPEPVLTPGQARAVLIQLARESRAG
jgi:putative heme iron utilization protein